MKIMQIFPGKVWGGAEQYVLDLSKALQSRGHQVMFLTRDSRAVTSRLKGEVTVEVLPFLGSWDICSAFRLARILRKAQPDIIHIHDTAFVPMVMMAIRFSHSRTKVVLTRHIARRSRVFPFYRTAFKKLHRIIFVSQLSKKLWMSANAWMPDEKTFVQHNSIPSTKSEETTPLLRSRFNISKETPLIVFTGRIRRSKGCAVLLQALGQVSHLPFALVFIGVCKPTSYQQQLEELARKHHISDKVHFFGFTDQVRLLIRDADIGVAPSIVREACHLSPMEFMEAGKCVVATNNGAQPEYITSGDNGLLVSPDASDQLAEALRTVLENPTYRETLGQAAQATFRRELSYDLFVDNILSVYRL